MNKKEGKKGGGLRLENRSVQKTASKINNPNWHTHFANAFPVMVHHSMLLIRITA
jgi:hypothetical protein